jgi:excinuclease ABC subunit C
LAKQIPNINARLKRDCQENTKSLIKVLQGKKIQALKDLKREMKDSSNKQDFIRAAKKRDQIQSMEKVLAHAGILKPQLFQITSWSETQRILQKILKIKKEISRIEAYDVSNLQGKLATGAMINFLNGFPDKNFYRKFKVKMQGKPNDVAMIKEILIRRFSHPEWPYPELILIDGGIAQLSAALKCKMQKAKCKMIKVIALAKRKNELYIEGRKEPILLKSLPREIFNLILQLRDEAHRFARKYHLKLREIDLRKKT